MQLHPSDSEHATRHTLRRLAAGYIGLDFHADVGDLLLKLIAARRKDLTDIEESLLACARIDVGYLRSWASALRVSDRLADFLPLSEP